MKNKENKIKKLQDEIKGMKYKNKEFIKLFREMEKCYFSNKKVCDWQEKHINKLANALEKIRKYCNECNLKADDTACEILAIIDEVLNNVEKRR